MTSYPIELTLWEKTGILRTMQEKAISGFSLDCVGAYPQKNQLKPIVKASVTIFEYGGREVGCPFLEVTSGNCNVLPNIQEKVKCVNLFPLNNKSKLPTAVNTENPLANPSVFKKPKLSETIVIDGTTIRKSRKIKGIIQQELSAKIGISRGYLPSIEANPKARVNKILAQRLAEALNLTVDDLSPTAALAIPSTLQTH